MMDKDEIIRQLKRENESLMACIKELEAKLAMYENAHTPPSLKRGGKRKKDPDKGSGKKPGHKGVTRPPAKPDRHVDVTKDRCPDCGTELGDPFSVETKVIEEIPDSDVDIINLSLGIPRTCDGSCPLCELVNAAAERAIIVAAAGNNGPEEGSISCPANSESCIAVGSVGKDGAVSNYSSRGAPWHLKPDIVAPGCIRYGDFKLEGTSIATPFVSASAALLLSMDNCNMWEVIRAIFETADDKGYPRWVQGYGLINMDKAVEVMLCD